MMISWVIAEVPVGYIRVGGRACDCNGGFGGINPFICTWIWRLSGGWRQGHMLLELESRTSIVLYKPDTVSVQAQIRWR